MARPSKTPLKDIQPSPVRAPRERIVVPLDRFTADLVRRLPGQTLSERVQALCRRVEFFRGAALEELKAQELSALDWTMIAMSLQQADGMDDYDTWRHYAWWAHTNRAGITTLYDADPLPLAARLRDAGDIINVAIREVIDRYWSMPPTVGNTDRLLALGLIDKKQAKEWAPLEKAMRRRISEAEQAVKDAEAQTLRRGSEQRAAKRRRLRGG